jgi:serine/threonine protein phosphatase PrpC
MWDTLTGLDTLVLEAECAVEHPSSYATVLCLCVQSTGLLCCANLGDSGAFLCRGEGEVLSLCAGHTASDPAEVALVVHGGDQCLFLE